MTAASNCKPSKRRMYAWEIEEARRVFADQLNYDRVRIHECAFWPNAVNRIGFWLKRMDPREIKPNAITLGNHCFFPVRLLETRVPPENADHDNICWLIHELTHAWQYQHIGWRYLFKALYAQLRLKDKAYLYGGEAGLVENFTAGHKIDFFNPEQQGDITCDYYARLCQKQNVSAWEPYIRQIQGLA